jgi:hypothetical protein
MACLSTQTETFISPRTELLSCACIAPGTFAGVVWAIRDACRRVWRPRRAYGSTRPTGFTWLTRAMAEAAVPPKGLPVPSAQGGKLAP